MLNFQQLGIEIRSQYQHKTWCPECIRQGKRKDNSLSVDPSNNVFNCHKCGWNNGQIKPQNQQNYIPQPPKQKKQGEYRPSQLRELKTAELAFFENRGINADTLFKAGVRGCTRWMPQTQGECDVLAFQFIKSNKRVNTKYRTADKQMAQDANAEKCFYNYEALERKPKRIHITEGEIDALTLMECGFKDVVSVPDGAPNPTANNLDNKFSYFTEEAMTLFDAIEEIVLVTDNDENGRFLESELRRRIGIDKCLFIQYPEGSKDINDVLVKEGPEAVEDVLMNAKHYPVDGLHTFADYEQEIIDMYNGVQQQYWATGWPHMDKHLKVKGGQLNIVTGTPGSGKSEWVDDLMINTVHNYGAKWAVFSPENYPVKVYFRKLSEKYESMNFSQFQESTLKNSISELSNHIHLIVDNDKDDVTMDYLFERIRTLVFRKGIKAVIIDPWNEISHVMGEREDQYLAKMLRKIKRFIRKYDLSFWLVAHPKNPQRNKDGNYNKITAYDIAGGYTWNAKADNIFSVWRDRQNNKKPVEVDILKIKYKTDGELGTCRFFYQYSTGKFQSCGSSLDDPTEVEDRGGATVNGKWGEI
jgi:twinkle protein